MRHVSLHDTIDTPSHTPAHTRLLEHTPPYNRIWALAFTKGTDNQYFRFHLSIGSQHRHGEASPQAKHLPRTPPISDSGSWTSAIHTECVTTITDDCDTRWVWLQSPSPCSMAPTIHNGLPRWPYFSNRSKCMVSSKDTMTSRKSQQQTRLIQWRPLSRTGWIGMVCQTNFPARHRNKDTSGIHNRRRCEDAL